MTHDPQSKATVVLKLLEDGDAMLCLDARHADVAVPREHAQNPSLRLILNLNFPSPIEITDDGVSANLAFGGRRFECYIPMDALWAAFNPETMQGMMWPDSMPPEVQAELATQTENPAAAPPAEKPILREAPKRQQTESSKASDETTSRAETTERKRGHLRVVK